MTSVFGAIWAVWGGSELAGTVGLVVLVVGIVAAVIIVALALRGITGTSPSPRDSMFRTRTYRITVAVEVVAVVAGVIVLVRLGLPQFVAVWVAAVVGVHFLVFGRAFVGAYYVVGGGLLVAALLGIGLAIAGGSQASVVAGTTLLSALVLLGSGVAALRRAQPGAPEVSGA